MNRKYKNQSRYEDFSGVNVFFSIIISLYHPSVQVFTIFGRMDFGRARGGAVTCCRERAIIGDALTFCNLRNRARFSSSIRLASFDRFSLE